MRATPSYAMRATQVLRGGGYDPKNGSYLGSFGHFGSGNIQKGVTTYSMSPNRQRPLAGTLNAAIFNTYRRSKAQVLFWVPPMIIAYYAMDWATKKNEFLNSKEGRQTEEEDEMKRELE